MKNLSIKILHILIIFIFSILSLGSTPHEKLVKYDGIIEHLAFNTLIAFPEKVFSQTNNKSIEIDSKKITPFEFKNILEELYINDYILIDIDQICNINDDDIILKELLLPPGKKPIMFSFDNVTYTSNYQNTGEIDKIIIDRNNSFATYSTKQSIQDRISHDNEFIPILENFIRNHSDFSPFGARGIINFTGINGVLGYTTNPKKSNSKQDTKRLKQLINKLKSCGWKFGSNNYSFVNLNTISEIELAKETSLWLKEIQPLIGNTQIYTLPYGIPLNKNTKEQILINNDFRIFFTNSNICTMEKQDNKLYISRKHVCGDSIRNTPEIFNNLFDCKKIYDCSSRVVHYDKNIY